mmetsp:Transcript_21170/g.65334  ORF Transcript_21170/g.65334 Transcript_21170/m.65334 type:complete len:280 (+) Transcript_21170:340-1179(+)
MPWPHCMSRAKLETVARGSVDMVRGASGRCQAGAGVPSRKGAPTVTSQKTRTQWAVPACVALTGSRKISLASAGEVKPGLSGRAKSTSKTGTGGARNCEGTDEKRKPYCFVNTTEHVSWSTFACLKERPPQSLADVMAATSAHSTTTAHWTPLGGTTRHDGASSRARASRKYSNADSPNSSVPNSSDTSTSGNLSEEAARKTSSGVTSVLSFSMMTTLCSRPFSRTLRRARSARLLDASTATTRRAPSRAASIASNPDPVPISSTTLSPGTIARSRHSL